jgi:hypothetical protein
MTGGAVRNGGINPDGLGNLGPGWRRANDIS